jgi:cell division protein FtsB
VAGERESMGMSSRAYAAPRRRVRRRVGPSRIRWDRIGRIALVLVLFGVLVSYLNPLVNLFEAWQGSKSSEQQLAQLKREKVDLSAQLRNASSPATLEREARRLGMVKSGEHAYVVHGLSGD